MRPDAAEGDFLVRVVDAAAHRVDNGLGLLEDLLLHEEVEVAFHNLLQLHLERRHLAATRWQGSSQYTDVLRLLSPVDAKAKALVDFLQN